MTSNQKVVIKGHSLKPVTSDSIGFYGDYWIQGNEISPENIERREKILNVLFPDGIHDKRIAELGPGGEGGFIHILQTHNDTIGFDVSASAIALCRRWGLNVEMKDLNVDPLPLENDTLDYIFAMEVFEHFSSPQFVLEEMYRVLKPEGRAIISTPNPLIYHWPKLFYPELFEAKAFHDLLISNQFAVEKRIGFKNLPEVYTATTDPFWHWIWVCKKPGPGDFRHFLDSGIHFWKKKDAQGFRKKPIEAIDFFRLSHEAAPSEPDPRFYLARSLVYRIIRGILEEFIPHFNYLTHMIHHGPEFHKSRALYHFAMIYVELEFLGTQGMSKKTFESAMDQLACRPDGALYMKKLRTALEKVQRRSTPGPNHNSIRPYTTTTADKTGNPDNPLPEVSSGTKQPVYLGLVKGDNYGWGVCSRYLIEMLSADLDVHVLQEGDKNATCANLDGALFQGLTNHEFTPLFPEASGARNFGYTFFENELTQRSIENAGRFDLVLGGSTWCRDRMMEKGIYNCDVLIQGIDPRIFYPIREIKSDDRFVLFSGGKFELRKGQDLVLRAVKILQEKYSDIWLVNCWYNLWPASTRLMEFSRHIQFKYQKNETWRDCMQRTYAMNGLDANRIITYELIPHEQQRNLFAGTDIGIFPNRCEGGTNLVLMEYMACAKPVIASNTSGHRDILTRNNALCLNTLSGFNVNNANGELIARWQEPLLDEMVACIEYAYHHRKEIRAIGRRAGEDLKHLTWEQTAKRLKQVMHV